MRQIPFRTQWIDYPDIQPVREELGVCPTTPPYLTDGNIHTVPTILDPSNGKAVTDSDNIFIYLSERFVAGPSHPAVAPASAEHQEIVNKLLKGISNPLFGIVFPVTFEQITLRGKEYVR